MKYDTREKALLAVQKKRGILYELPERFKDDDEIVRIAISRGDDLKNASFRLSHDIDMVLHYASNCDMDNDYERVLFCLMKDPNLPERYYSLFEEGREFNLLLKIHHGDAFRSHIESYNHMSKMELVHELVHVRRSLVYRCIEAHELGFQDDVSNYLLHNPDMVGTEIGWYPVSFYYRNEGLEDLLQMIRMSSLNYDRKKMEFCSVGGTGSFPERVMAGVLEELGVMYIREKTFSWSFCPNMGMSGPRRYDFYIPSINTIIEVHGAQHYTEAHFADGCRTLEEEQANDVLKERLAKSNGIQDYIIVDASRTSMANLRESIEANRDFCRIFDIGSLDWMNVYRFAVGDNTPPENFPLYDFRRNHYAEWCDTIENVLKDMEKISVAAQGSAE